jgi:hypothetical protein
LVAIGFVIQADHFEATHGRTNQLGRIRADEGRSQRDANIKRKPHQHKAGDEVGFL